jgi:beta-N-acetylhexosaminidase
VTLVKNDGEVVPLKNPPSTAFITMIEGPTSTQGMAFLSEVRKRVRDATAITVDARMSESDLQAAVARASQAANIVVAAFASVAAYRGSVSLGGGFPQMMDQLIATGRPVTLVAMGNPYLLRNFPGVAAYLTTYSTVPPSEIAAVKALTGEIDIQGKLPVTIPGFAQYGDGIALSKMTH